LAEEHCGITTSPWTSCRTGWHGPRYRIMKASNASHRPTRTCSAGHQMPASVRSRGDKNSPGDRTEANLLRGTMALADVKTKSCDDKYPGGRSGLACAVVTKRQKEVNGKYHKKAGELDIEQGTVPRRHGSITEITQRARTKGPYDRSSDGSFCRGASRHLRHCRLYLLCPRQ
jgi:hypothetical protein